MTIAYDIPKEAYDSSRPLTPAGERDLPDLLSRLLAIRTAFAHLNVVFSPVTFLVCVVCVRDISVQRSPPVQSGSLSDLPTQMAENAEQQVTLRKRKQPKQCCDWAQELQSLRKDI